MRTTLVIMAAGLGSRFGGGIKQLAPVGLNGEIIMDYSIHDAIEAGFNKIVFIIRKDIKDAFKEAIGDRIEKICNNLDVEIAYAYQELSELPEGVELPTGRTNLGEQDMLFLPVKKFCMSHLQLSMQMTTMERKHLLSFMISL